MFLKIILVTTLFLLSVSVQPRVSLHDFAVGNVDPSCLNINSACDWTSALNAAIAADDNSIYIPSGTYHFLGVNIAKSNLSITGDGASTVIRCPSNYPECTIFKTYRTGWGTEVKKNMIGNIHISNLKFKGYPSIFPTTVSDGKGVAIQILGVRDSILSNLWHEEFDKFLMYDNFKSSVVSNIVSGSIDENLESNYIIYSRGEVTSNDLTFDKIVGRAFKSNIWLGRQNPMHGSIQDGIKITNSYLYHSGEYNLYIQHGTNVLISGNEFFGGNDGTIFLNRVENLVLSNNILINAADGDDNIGIHLAHDQSQDNLRFGNVQINNNLIRDATAHGIKIDKYYGVNIIGNTIKNACSGSGVWDGIHVRYSSAGQVVNNFIYSENSACRSSIRILEEGSVGFTY